VTELSTNTVTLNQRLSDLYSSQPWLRSLLALVPTVGGSLDILFTAKHNELVQKRTTILLNELQKNLSCIEEKINREFLNSDEFHDMFILALERVTRISDENRIKAVSSILADSITGIPAQDIHPVDLISILSELSDQELQVLSVVIGIYQNKKELLTEKELVKPVDIKSQLPGIIQPSSGFLCDRLVGKGLLESGYGHYRLSSAAISITKYLQIR
jgi:hypothetical protein